MISNFFENFAVTRIFWIVFQRVIRKDGGDQELFKNRHNHDQIADSDLADQNPSDLRNEYVSMSIASSQQ